MRRFGTAAKVFLGWIALLFVIGVWQRLVPLIVLALVGALLLIPSFLSKE